MLGNSKLVLVAIFSYKWFGVLMFSGRYKGCCYIHDIKMNGNAAWLDEIN